MGVEAEAGDRDPNPAGITITADQTQLAGGVAPLGSERRGKFVGGLIGEQ